ncbi:acyl carrier protein [Aureitalea marina]|uniref:Acyl carrier protein n=1 Tax=Aureitalea marina TaxID=930804 RepID=A0A2S7KP58_9FLAO|nr:acyl carrier protein [Aureitalea marina]PQB04387.1 acyl carrier protein [Aureitalea marina]
MTPDSIYKTLKPIIEQYLPEDVSVDEISPEADLTGELNINSAHLVDIVLDVEDAFDIELTNDDMENLRTVQDAVDIIWKKAD